MREPTLEDYGLTDAEFLRCVRLNSETAPATAWLTWLVCTVGFAYYSPAPGDMFSRGLLGAALSLVPALLVRPMFRHLIPGVALANRFVAAYLAFQRWKERTDLAFWLSLPGREFEMELAGLLERSGWGIVTLTPARGDKGIDIKVIDAGETTIIQCKATKKPVGVRVVRELYGALHDCGADVAILAVTGGVTKGVLEFIEDKPIMIMRPAEFVELQLALGESASERQQGNGSK